MIDDALERGQATAEQEQALLRRALLAQLGAQTRPGAVVGQRSFDEAAEEQRLLLLLHDQATREVGRAVHGIAGGLELLAEVPVGGRQLFPEQVPQVEEAVDPAEQHLQLEQDLLAARDLQGPDPTLPLRQIDGADALRVAHQLEEKILRKAAPIHPFILRQLRNPRDFATSPGTRSVFKRFARSARNA